MIAADWRQVATLLGGGMRASNIRRIGNLRPAFRMRNVIIYDVDSQFWTIATWKDPS